MPIRPSRLVLGLDFGSDSVRALVVDAERGRELGAGTAPYRAWAAGRWCDPARQAFRQHPRDHLAAMTTAVRQALAEAGAGTAARIAAIGVGATGSSPMPLGRDGRALAFDPAFAEDPDALVLLWKDHTAIAEAERFNELSHAPGATDYTRFVGGTYSSEWWWAKIAHITAVNRRVARAAATWVEHCDWIPAELCGITDPAQIARSRCAAGHKAAWHPSWGGLPDEAFLTALEPRLAGLRARLYQDTATADQPAGTLSPAWARRFGLRPGIPVAGGAIDAHLGAVGAGAGPHVLAKVIGTSTCDMLCVPPADLGERTVRGICGQVEGSILPGLVGLEAGQSAFGDVFAWYRRLLTWGDTDAKRAAGLLPALEKAALALPPGAGGLVALDWFNGRRTPDADQRQRGAIAGLHLGHDAPAVYRSLVEAVACGARAINDGFTGQGVAIRSVVALGGIAKRSPLVMQVLADLLERPIRVAASDQCCALGAAITGAAAGGLHPSIAAAQRRMASPVAGTYRPQRRHQAAYRRLFAAYQELGRQAGRPA